MNHCHQCGWYLLILSHTAQALRKDSWSIFLQRLGYWLDLGTTQTLRLRSASHVFPRELFIMFT